MGITAFTGRANELLGKFVSISEEIIERIKTGELQPGDKIPSENDLIKTYRISNTTARKSLLEIENQGWARRIEGKGTFVLNRTVGHHLIRTLGSINATRRGFHESLIAEGFEPHNVVLEKTVLDDGISSEIGGKHFIIGGPVLKVHQLRYADNEIIKDEIKYISLSVCPKINRMPRFVRMVHRGHYFFQFAVLYQLLKHDVRIGQAGFVLFRQFADLHHVRVEEIGRVGDVRFNPQIGGTCTGFNNCG